MNEQALKARLKFIAKKENRSFQEVWKLLILERLLVRLAHSNYFDKFIFKGGLLLSHYLVIARETTDIDLLAKNMKIVMSSVEKAFNEICDVIIADGFVMSFAHIDELDHTHMNYPGYRVRINVQLGKMKDHIQIDIGVGDIVTPKEESLTLYQYKGKPIFEGSMSLQVYPVETIFSEKLESIISRGATNSRMKDFHDVLLLCREKNLINIDKLKTDIKNTFKHRQTKRAIPITFNQDEYSRLQLLWSAHLRVLGDIAKNLNFPNTISELIEEINIWLIEVLDLEEVQYV